GRAAKGKAIVNLIQISEGERVAAILPIREFASGRYVVMATKKGILKKTDLIEYSRPRTGGIIALSIDEGDELIDVRQTLGDQDIFLGTRKGMAIRFKETDVRDMGRVARGVIGIRMDEDDEIVGMEILGEGNGNTIITVSERGFGKRTNIDEYRPQARGGRGLMNLRTVPKVGFVSGIRQVTGEEDLMLISNTGNIIRMRVDEIPVHHRVTQGVRLIDLGPDEQVVSLARTERKSEVRDEDADLPDEGGEPDEDGLL
ncbi:MAG: DNA gyrase C-terminal beta-propeller domain-containing protein, partial [Syntrophales bacterium]|nr:DNA gyrase C-terminal beta-propeller domain-containing protein [Syntrophales bacterium]